MSIYKRNSMWYIDFCTPSGERIRCSAKTTDRKEAQEYHDRLKAELWRISKLKERRAYSFEEACVAALKLSEEQRNYEAKLSHVAYWRTHFSGRDISSLTSDEIMEALPAERLCKNRPPRKLKKATQNRYLSTIRFILNVARKKGWIDFVPYLPAHQEPKKHIRWLNKSEAHALINAMSLEWMKDVSLFALLTGARANEILSLTWDKVDLNRSMAWVTEDLAKSGVARPLPLNSEAVAILQKRKLKGQHWCFTRDNGSGIMINQVDKRVIDRAAIKIGIKPIRFHDFRHTWASWHVQSGTPLMVLKDLGGWETIEMVQKYAHLDAGHLAQYSGASRLAA